MKNYCFNGNRNSKYSNNFASENLYTFSEWGFDNQRIKSSEYFWKLARVRTFWGIHLTNKILGFNKKYDDILSLIVPILSN